MSTIEEVVFVLSRSRRRMMATVALTWFIVLFVHAACAYLLLAVVRVPALIVFTSFLAGGAAAALAWMFLQRAEQRREHDQREHDRAVAVNHEIRNALEMLMGAGFTIADRETGNAICASCERIVRALAAAFPHRISGSLPSSRFDLRDGARPQARDAASGQ